MNEFVMRSELARCFLVSGGRVDSGAVSPSSPEASREEGWSIESISVLAAIVEVVLFLLRFPPWEEEPEGEDMMKTAR